MLRRKTVEGHGTWVFKETLIADDPRVGGSGAIRILGAERGGTDMVVLTIGKTDDFGDQANRSWNLWVSPDEAVEIAKELIRAAVATKEVRDAGSQA